MLKMLRKCDHINTILRLNTQLIARCRLLSDDNKPSDDNANTDSGNDDSVDVIDKLSFSKAFTKFEKITIEDQEKKRKAKAVVEENVTFPTLLRHSPFIQMGDFRGRVVIGTVVNIVADDLYIDFGGKFDAVCKRPKLKQSDYVRGVKVKIRLHDLELSDRFLGSNKDMTLLEADATLIGMVWSPASATSASPKDSTKDDTQNPIDGIQSKNIKPNNEIEVEI